jgi:hypothetical protein
MENEIWECHGNNTNVAEAAHAQANREGKQLKLVTAIMRLIFYCIFEFVVYFNFLIFSFFFFTLEVGDLMKGFLK